MSDFQEFDFNDDSIANAYDNMLVPIIFDPWATRLLDEFHPWEGRHVLDLATGTGVVAQHLTQRVGPSGAVIAVDINSEMLTVAAKRCAGQAIPVKFVESPASPLAIESDAVDFVVCQQGFQFFPDRLAAAREIYRVLKSDGNTVITTWCPTGECHFFEAVCEALDDIEQPEISKMMRVPFDNSPESELINYFESSGFANVKLIRQEQDFVLAGGLTQAIEIAYATPIGPKLKALPDEIQDQFRIKFSNLLSKLSDDGTRMGQLASNVLSANKPG